MFTLFLISLVLSAQLFQLPQLLWAQLSAQASLAQAGQREQKRKNECQENSCNLSPTEGAMVPIKDSKEFASLNSICSFNPPPVDMWKGLMFTKDLYVLGCLHMLQLKAVLVDVNANPFWQDKSFPSWNRNFKMGLHCTHI